MMLSTQQLTSCATAPNQGCNGGFTEKAYRYIQRTGGLETEADYPYSSATYQGLTGTCKEEASKFKVTVTGFSTLANEAAMATYAQTTGPISVCVAAGTWNSYKSGIMTTCGRNVDHCVQAVGVDASATGYWKVRNSWGADWGENGHVRLAYGANTCQITNDPTVATVKLA